MSHILISEIWVSQTTKFQDLSNLAVLFLTTTNINTSSECQQRHPMKCFPLFFFSWLVSKSTLMHQFSLKSFTNTSRIYKSRAAIGNKALTDVFLCPQRKQLFVEFRIMKSSLTYRFKQQHIGLPNVYQQFLLVFIASRLIRPFLCISLNKVWATDVGRETDGKIH